MKRTLSLVMVLVLALSLLGCGAKTNEPAPAEEVPAEEPAVVEEPVAEEAPADEGVTVTDMTGREIHLDKPAERIVALTASDCEILYAVGAGDLLVGRGTYCDYPTEVLDIPSIGSGNDTNVEDVIAMKPDVLLMSTMAQTEEQVAQLEAAGVAVVVTDAADIAGTYDAIRLIGALVGHDAEAEAVIAGMQAKFDELVALVAAKNIPEEEKPTIYFEISPIYYGLWSAGGGTFMNEVAEMLGLVNIFAAEPSWAQVSEEQIISANPQFILTTTMYYGDAYDSADAEIMGRPGWENIPAVQNGTILLTPNNELTRPGPRLADGAQILYDFVYGE